MNKESQLGCWRLWKYEKGEKIRIFQDTDPKIHNIYDTPNDCEGSVLFDYMSDHGIINDWDEYETEGELEAVAIMHKTGDKPDFQWTFIANAPPRPASDDCHTYS